MIAQIIDKKIFLFILPLLMFFSCKKESNTGVEYQLSTTYNSNTIMYMIAFTDANGSMEESGTLLTGENKDWKTSIQPKSKPFTASLNVTYMNIGTTKDLPNNITINLKILNAGKVVKELTKNIPKSQISEVAQISCVVN